MAETRLLCAFVLVLAGITIGHVNAGFVSDVDRSSDYHRVTVRTEKFQSKPQSPISNRLERVLQQYAGAGNQIQRRVRTQSNGRNQQRRSRRRGNNRFRTLSLLFSSLLSVRFQKPNVHNRYKATLRKSRRRMRSRKTTSN